ncbi:hypothetical protein Hanom_Chr07g00588461 [Helianthus anomalus]
MDEANEPDENDKIETFWIKMRKNKLLDESCKTGQTSEGQNGILLFLKIILL